MYNVSNDYNRFSNSRIHVIGVSTNENTNSQNWELSLKKNNFTYEILGKNKIWGGWRWRMKIFYNYLINKKPDDIIMISDIYDVLFIKDHDQLLKKFHLIRKGKRILFFVEYSKSNIPIKILDKNENYYYKYINAGMIIGYANDLTNLYKWVLENNYEDDQIGISNFVNLNPDLYSIDTLREVGLNISSKFDLKFHSFSEKGVFCKNGIKLSCDPCVIHLPCLLFFKIAIYNKIAKFIGGKPINTIVSIISLISKILIEDSSFQLIIIILIILFVFVMICSISLIICFIKKM